MAGNSNLEKLLGDFGWNLNGWEKIFAIWKFTLDQRIYDFVYFVPNLWEKLALLYCWSNKSYLHTDLFLFLRETACSVDILLNFLLPSLLICYCAKFLRELDIFRLLLLRGKPYFGLVFSLIVCPFSNFLACFEPEIGVVVRHLFSNKDVYFC